MTAPTFLTFSTVRSVLKHADNAQHSVVLFEFGWNSELSLPLLLVKSSGKSKNKLSFEMKPRLLSLSYKSSSMNYKMVTIMKYILLQIWAISFFRGQLSYCQIQ